MVGKKVSFTKKPSESAETVEDWILTRHAETQESAPPKEPLKRLTLDIPMSLHRRLKIEAAQKGTTILAIVEGLLRDRFPGD